MSCGVGCRCGLDMALLWLWCRPAAVTLIRLLAWEYPEAAGAALKSKIKTERKKKNDHHGSAEVNPIRTHEDADSIPGLTQWVKDQELLWLWCRTATVTLIQPLARELPYAAGVALRIKRPDEWKGGWFQSEVISPDDLYEGPRSEKFLHAIDSVELQLYQRWKISFFLNTDFFQKA